ncbi:MAG: GNAT family N-acetyltransferase, partial [Alphaproteobacteria bacterium]
ANLPHPYTPADAACWIEGYEKSTALPLRLAVFVAPRQVLVGACGIMLLENTSDFHLGYWIGEPYWGRGFATEAARCVIDHVFATLPIRRLWCTCRVTNSHSRRVIEKCGFQYHIAGMEFSRALGSSVPVERHCLDREVWEAEQNDAPALTIQCH